MRLPLTCFQCFYESSKPIQKVWVEYQDSNLYEYTCPNGHQAATILKQQKLEILFDIGVNAILDGYYREAVASFASSLERFYEFFIKVKLTHDQINSDAIDKAWKDVSRQSERQLGAFILLYTQTFGEAPSLLNQNKVNFRNEVIHKGKIPTRSEATEFGQSVLDTINPIANKMATHLHESILKITYQDIEKLNKDLVKSKGETSWTTHFNAPSLLNVSARPPEYTPATLTETLDHMKKLREFSGTR